MSSRLGRAGQIDWAGRTSRLNCYKNCNRAVGCKSFVFSYLGERAMGFEPTTSSLGSWHSTTELRPRA